MKEFIRIGVDLGKNYFQIHALESEDGHAATRKLSRQAMRKFFSETKPCVAGMEACGSAHYWARELQAMGHEARLIPPVYVKPYVKRGKNDAAGAAAVCEALSRPNMRFVPVKSAAQQADLMLHKTRELLVAQRTMTGNAVRGHLSEFGCIAAKGIGRVADLIETAEAGRSPSRPRRRCGFSRASWPGSKNPSPNSTPKSRRRISKIPSAGCWRAFRASAQSPPRRSPPACRTHASSNRAVTSPHGSD
jgi:transposase